MELLLVSLHGDLVELHQLLEHELRHALIAGVGLHFAADLEPLALGLLPQIILVQPVVIFDVHVFVDKVVQEPLILSGFRQNHDLSLPCSNCSSSYFLQHLKCEMAYWGYSCSLSKSCILYLGGSKL